MQAGLKLSPGKCTLFAKEVAYLGHVIGRDGVKTDPGKITAVEWSGPYLITSNRYGVFWVSAPTTGALWQNLRT